jgi:hypothetical protein
MKDKESEFFPTDGRLFLGKTGYSQRFNKFRTRIEQGNVS